MLSHPAWASLRVFFLLPHPSSTAEEQAVPLCQHVPVHAPAAAALVCTCVCFSLVFLCVSLCFSACTCVCSQHALLSSLPPAPLPSKGTDDTVGFLRLVTGWEASLRRLPEKASDFVFCRKCSGPQALRSEQSHGRHAFDTCPSVFGQGEVPLALRDGCVGGSGL